MNSNTGKRASLPGGSYARLQHFDQEQLVVRVMGEDGEDLGEYRFNDLEGPRKLLVSLVTGFAEGAKPGGRWTSQKTLKENSKRLTYFYREIQLIAPQLERLEDLTPTEWITWREQMRARSRWPGTINSIRVILQLCPELPSTVREVLQVRHRKPRSRSVVHEYSRDDFRRIQQVAWKIVDAAAIRIRSSARHLHRYRVAMRTGESLSPREMTLGRLLDELGRTGDLPRGANGATQSAAAAAIRRAGLTRTACNALFLEPNEVFAFMVLFAALRGYNPDTIAELTIEHQRPDGGLTGTPIINTRLRKLRASAGQQEVSDNLVGRTERSAAGLMRLAIELTEPARAALREAGEPTTRLLVCRLRAPLKGQRFFVESINRTQASANWYHKGVVRDENDKPVRVTLQRVRLTEQGLNRHPRLNSIATHETEYTMPQQMVIEDSQDAIVAGQTEALANAQVNVLARILPKDTYKQLNDRPAEMAEKLGLSLPMAGGLLAGQLDTVLAACLDFDRSPFSDNGSCTASFLLCLACENAIATPNHLPRLVALRYALENLASAVTPDVWNEDYAVHYERLKDLLSTSATQEELSRATAAIQPSDIQAVEALLSRKIDA